MAWFNLFNDKHENFSYHPHIPQFLESFIMLLKLGSVRLSHAPMEVELKLDQKDRVYTHRDAVSGQVILCTESAADLSTVVLKLSGTAISRLSHSSRTETHQVCVKMVLFKYFKLGILTHNVRFLKSLSGSSLQIS
jgi:hypothetical protein